MKLVDIEARVRRVAWPAPPPDLRARVLAAVPVTAPAVTWSDRVWFSRACRLAAVAAVLILAVLESMSGHTRPGGATVPPQAVAEASVIQEMAEQAGLSPEQAAALARRAAATERKARSGSGFGGMTIEDFDSRGEPR